MRAYLCKYPGCTHMVDTPREELIGKIKEFKAKNKEVENG